MFLQALQALMRWDAVNNILLLLLLILFREHCFSVCLFRVVCVCVCMCVCVCVCVCDERSVSLHLCKHSGSN